MNYTVMYFFRLIRLRETVRFTELGESREKKVTVSSKVNRFIKASNAHSMLWKSFQKVKVKLETLVEGGGKGSLFNSYYTEV